MEETYVESILAMTHTPLDTDSQKLRFFYSHFPIPPLLPPYPNSALWVRKSALFPPDTNPQCSELYIPVRSHAVFAGQAVLWSPCLSALLDQQLFAARQMTDCPAFYCSHMFISLDKQTDDEERSAQCFWRRHQSF